MPTQRVRHAQMGFAAQVPPAKIGLLGASGYVGQLIDALSMHGACMELIALDSRDVDRVSPAQLRELDAVLLALPDDVARAWCERLSDAGVRALDLSGAHRRTPGVHYGIPELWGAPPSDATLVANPGCYPTAALLPLVPLRRAGLIADAGISIVGMSGTSGAGKATRPELHFSEMFGNTFPYQVGEHKHIAEIEHHLGCEVNFVTQLLPIVRGLQVTAFVRPTQGRDALEHALREHYAQHRYVHVLDKPGQGLSVRNVVGSHQALLAVGPTARSGLVPVFGTIDNLMRGAASSALHNLNLWLGRDPFLGLPAPTPMPHDDVVGMTRLLP